MTEYNFHILPRCLLEEFVSRSNGKELYTFLYRNGKKAIETNIFNLSANGEIAHFDNEFARLLYELRETKDRAEVSHTKVSEFITQLCIQKKHLRDSFRTSSEFLFDSLYQFILNLDNVKILILNNPELVKEQLENASRYIPALNLFKGILQLEPSALDAFLTRYKSVAEMALQTFVAKYKGKLLKKIEESHSVVLTENSFPELREQDFQQLRWFICESKNRLILGDTGCLFETAGAKRFKPLPNKDDVIENVFLPVSSDRMLIGTALPSIPQIDFNLINEATAKCSKDFFICSESSSVKIHLLPSIGTESEIVSKEELEQLLKEMAKGGSEWLNGQVK